MGRSPERVGLVFSSALETDPAGCRAVANHLQHERKSTAIRHGIRELPAAGSMGLFTV